MNREQIIAMAREANCVEASHPFNPWSVSQEALERFAALVAAAEREAIRARSLAALAAAAERETILARGENA